MTLSAIDNGVLPASESEPSALVLGLIDECQAMAEFSMSSGLSIDPGQIEKLHLLLAKENRLYTNDEIRSLSAIHKALSRTIAPATPNGILQLQREKARKHPLNFLGPVPLVRHLTITSLTLLFILIAVGLHPEVNTANINKGFLNSQGYELLLNLIFILACAGLGGCFSALFRLNRFIINANYDPKFDSTYWIRLLLGIISGLFIVELIPPSVFLGENNQTNALSSFGKPAIAMLGGFSATMVYRILQRVVEAAESLVKGDQQSLRRAEAQLKQRELEQYKQAIHGNVSTALKSLEVSLASGDAHSAQQQLAKTLSSIENETS